MKTLWKWLVARVEWAWCALGCHALTEAHQCRNNNRRGQVASIDRWLSCACGQRVGPITRQRYLGPYPEAR